MEQKIIDKSERFFSGKSIDDLMFPMLEALIKYGKPISPTKGDALEICGVVAELENPRARFSKSESRGRIFSALGEFCWYMSGSGDVDPIEYYMHRYHELAEGKIVHGAYGPRIFNWHDQNQMENIVDLLKRKHDSRQAVIQIFDATDIVGDHKDVPCTCLLQFLLREDKLNLICYMRSNDIYLGFPHDVFCFTMIQELIARKIGVEIGTYTHLVGSLHLYETDRKLISNYFQEGYQSTEYPMPAMPLCDPIPSLEVLLNAEELLRSGKRYEEIDLEDVDSYWVDLILLLASYQARKYSELDRMNTLFEKISSRVYREYLRTKIEELRGTSKEKR